MASNNDRIAQAPIDDLIAEAMLGPGLVRNGRAEVITQPTPEVVAETRRQRELELAPHLAEFQVNLDRAVERARWYDQHPNLEVAPEVVPPHPMPPLPEPIPRCYVVTATGATPNLYNFFRQWLPDQTGLAGSIVPLARDAVTKLAPLHLDGNVVIVSEGIYWKDANGILAFWKWAEPKCSYEPMAAIDRAVRAHSVELPELGGHFAGQHQHILRIEAEKLPGLHQGARFINPQTAPYITYVEITSYGLNEYANKISLRAWGKMIGTCLAPDAVFSVNGKMLRPEEVIAVARAMADASQDKTIEGMRIGAGKWAESTEPINQISEALNVASNPRIVEPKIEPLRECVTVYVPSPPRHHSERTYRVQRDDPWYTFFEQVREIAIAQKLMGMPDLEKYDAKMRDDLTSLDDAFYLNHNSVFWVAPPYPDERNEAASKRGGVEQSGVDSTPLRAIHRSGWQLLDPYCGHVCDIVRNGDDLPAFSPRLFKPFSVVYVSRWRSPTPAEERAVKLAKNKYSVVVFLAPPSEADAVSDSLAAWAKMLDGHIADRAFYVLPVTGGHRAASLTEVAELKQQLTTVTLASLVAPVPSTPTATQDPPVPLVTQASLAEPTSCNLQ